MRDVRVLVWFGGGVAIVAFCGGCPPGSALQTADFEMHSFGPNGPTVFSDNPSYDVPVHSTHTYTAAQLSVIPRDPVNGDLITGVYSNTTPDFFGQNEVLFFARDPDEQYATFSQMLERYIGSNSNNNHAPGTKTWDLNATTPLGRVSLAVWLPDAVGMPYPLSPTNASATNLILNTLLFVGASPNEGLTGPANDPTGGSVKAAYVIKHGTCSGTAPIQPILNQIDTTVFQGLGGSGPFGIQGQADYVHSISWITEGVGQSNPPNGGFIVAASAEIAQGFVPFAQTGQVRLNTTYTFALDTAFPNQGILMVQPSENEEFNYGFHSSQSLGDLKNAFNTRLPGTLEAISLAVQANPVPALSPPTGVNCSVNPAPISCFIPCAQPDGAPSASDVASNAMLAFQQRLCPGVQLTLATAIGSTTNGGVQQLHINPSFGTALENTLTATNVQTDGLTYFNNIRCNYAPGYVVGGTPVCEVVARGTRIVAMPDQVEVVFFDRDDGGGLTDFSSDAEVQSLVGVEGFALFVALNNTFASPQPNFGALCGLAPATSSFVYHPYAHDQQNGLSTDN